MKFQSSIVALAHALAALAATGSAARISMSSVASYWKRAGGSTSSCPTAVAVAWAESRGDTTAKGYNSNSIDRGLWQINNYWHRDVSDSCAFDAGCNARAALRISSGGSRWSPWATYNDGLHHRWMSAARTACGGSSSSSSSRSCSSCLYYGGGRACASKCSRSYSCQNCIRYGGGYGCRSKCSSSYDEANFDALEDVGGGQRDEMNDEDDEEVGGVWGKIGGIIGNDIWNRPVADGSCRGRCRRLRTRVEDVARRLPDPRGEWDFDEEGDDENVGIFGAQRYISRDEMDDEDDDDEAVGYYSYTKLRRL